MSVFSIKKGSLYLSRIFPLYCSSSSSHEQQFSRCVWRVYYGIKSKKYSRVCQWENYFALVWLRPWWEHALNLHVWKFMLLSREKRTFSGVALTTYEGDPCKKKMGILICDRFVSLFYKSLEFYFLPLLNSTVKFTQCYTPIPRLTSPCCNFFLRIKFPRTKSQTPLDDVIKDNYDYRSNDIGNREIVSCTVSEIQWLACHCPCRIFMMPGNRGLRYWTTAGRP